MRATIRIDNCTAWRSDHLRAFVERARVLVFGDQPKRLRVRFLTSVSHIHGRASIGGTMSVIWLPPTAATRKAEIAQILMHELAHNGGANGERWMRRSKRFGWGPGWRESAAWGNDLPLELKPAKPAETPQERIARKLDLVLAREKAWRTKAKRAATALKKLARQRGYYQRALAASDSPGVEQ